MVDWVPGLSQAKSLFQLACGDADGAGKTQINFVTKCPGLAHLVGAEIYILGTLAGDKDSIEFGKNAFYGGTKTISDVADGTPIVGHIKSGAHLVCGDIDGAGKAFISANRTSAVMAGGAAGFISGGPVGSVVGGMMTGATMDGISFVKGEPRGVFAFTSVKTSGEFFDTVCAVASDAMTGYAGGKYVDKALRSNQIDAYENILEKRKEHVGPHEQVNKIEVYSEVTDLETGRKYYGTNRNIRNRIPINGPSPDGQNLFVEQNPIETRPLDRPPTTCAEIQAYDQLLRDNPNAQTTNTHVNTFLYKDGTWKNMQTCKNCDARSHAMGDISTNPREGGLFINLDVPDHMPSEFYEHQIYYELEMKERPIATHAEYNRSASKTVAGAIVLRKKAQESDDDEDFILETTSIAQ